MDTKTYDFSGWATRNNLRCADGRTIRKDAFIDNDGTTVPLVWNHGHKDQEDVLGHALLENREDGVYCYCKLNDTPRGLHAGQLIKNGDVKSLSIYANHLKQNKNGEVFHGAIREVSIVLAGANPGAYIDSVLIHSEDDGTSEEAYIYSGESDCDLEMAHSESDADNIESETEGKTKEAVEEVEDEDLSHAENEKENEQMADQDRTVQEVIDGMSEEQKTVLYALVGQALEDGKSEGAEDMKHNLFDNEDMEDENVISHSDMMAIIDDAKRYGSMKESALQHGIDDIEYLFPDNKNLTNTPGFIRNEPSDWVKVVMNGVKHTPFARIKMMFADIREDEARAKGFLKGNTKKEEVFSLLKRSVDPTTIYKLQKMHRDDIVDITDFDVVAWIKGEMRTMLDEEIARAILFGDGRLASSEEHIDATKVIPACSDATLYTISKTVTAASGESEPHAIIRSTVEAMDSYQGSGNVVGFFKQADITSMLLMEDTMGHRLYKNKDELASAMLLNKIVAVPASIVPTGTKALVLDLSDYNVGADKGGAVNMFDDFDIDLNKQAYLMETRCSGALVKPYSAIALKDAD